MLLQTSMKQHKQCKMSKNKPKEYKSKQFFFIFILKKIANQTYMIKNSFIPKQKKKKKFLKISISIDYWEWFSFIIHIALRIIF